jgi:hypothetical protein
MVDIPELLELYQGEGIMHPWHTLNLSRCFLFSKLVLYFLLNHVPVLIFTIFEIELCAVKMLHSDFTVCFI